MAVNSLKIEKNLLFYLIVGSNCYEDEKKVLKMTNLSIPEFWIWWLSIRDFSSNQKGSKAFSIDNMTENFSLKALVMPLQSFFA